MCLCLVFGKAALLYLAETTRHGVGRHYELVQHTSTDQLSICIIGQGSSTRAEAIAIVPGKDCSEVSWLRQADVSRELDTQ